MKDRIRHIIGGILIAVGILACLGAVGTMDYNTENHIVQSDTYSLIEAGVGIGVIAVGFFLLKDLELMLDEDKKDR